MGAGWDAESYAAGEKKFRPGRRLNCICCSLKGNEHSKHAVSPPAIAGKVAVEGENLSCFELVGKMDQTSVGKVCRHIAVFSENGPDRSCSAIQMQGNLKNSLLHIGEHCFRRFGDSTQQIAAFSDDCFASGEGLIQGF